MAAVTGIDDRDAGVAGSAERRTLFGMAHCHDISIAGDHTDGICNAFSLGSAADALAREAQYMAAQVQHGRLKGKAGAGRRLIEQSGKLFVSRNVLVSGRIGADAVGQIQQRGDLLLAEIQGINEMAHEFYLRQSNFRRMEKSKKFV